MPDVTRRPWLATTIVVICLVASAGCESSQNVDTRARCDVGVTGARLDVSEGNVVPQNMQKTVDAEAARRMYREVCDAILRAPPLPDFEDVHCPNAKSDPGTVRVTVYSGDKVFDVLEITVTGCRSTNSQRVGRVAFFVEQIPSFESVEVAICRGFDITAKQIGG
ncbi:MAG TPA: hypothetical protein VFN21_03145 [Acidimicrobiales bacterium]|nr:hypothetical protein [Acidimicrobiales bacterium]